MCVCVCVCVCFIKGIEALSVLNVDSLFEPCQCRAIRSSGWCRRWPPQGGLHGSPFQQIVFQIIESENMKLFGNIQRSLGDFFSYTVIQIFLDEREH